ncbi:hypothetical protein P8452_68611 [Trifolium repens]|nr:hypothetical protein P8452_68611 [Trifolium repens]
MIAVLFYYLTPLSRVGRLYSCTWQKVYLVKQRCVSRKGCIWVSMPTVSGRGFIATYGRRLIWLTCTFGINHHGQVAEGVDCWFPDVNVKSKLRCVDELEWDPFL